MKVLGYPPTPAKRRGEGESVLREDIRREPIVSPETSPETIKTLSSPSLAAMSATLVFETKEKFLEINEIPETNLSLILLLNFQFIRVFIMFGVFDVVEVNLISIELVIQARFTTE